MVSKKQISRKYLIFYVMTILFSILYSSTFLIASVLLAFSSIWLLDIYLFPEFIGSLLILSTLIPRIHLKKDDTLAFNESCFIENTRKIAVALGSSYPKNIYVVFDTNAYAYSHKGEEVIAVGFPLAIMMDKFELSSIIAHELAHHFQGDIRYGKNISKVESFFFRLMNTLASRWVLILVLPYKFVAKRIFREIKRLSRQNEYHADLKAAEVIGKCAMTSALKKLELNDRSWKSYLSQWVWLLNLNQTYVDIVENYRLFFSLTNIGVDDWRLIPNASGEYDSHPTTYERVLELEEKCIHDTAEVELEEYTIDCFKLSMHFWNMYNGGITKNIFDSSKKALVELSQKMSREYKSIFETYTYKDASLMMDIYPKVSYNLYQKTQNDQFEFEKDMITKILSFIIFEKIRPENWRIGVKFTPILMIQGEEHDLYYIIYNNFDHNYTKWNELLKLLNINTCELINELNESILR